MNRYQMTLAINLAYPNWRAEGKSDKQVQAVYFRLKREGLIK